MMGKKTCVGVQIKSKFSPIVVQVHCIAHRLNLAVTDSIKNEQILEKFKEKFCLHISPFIDSLGTHCALTRLILKSIR